MTITSAETAVWLYCEKCGSPMTWREQIGKFSPVTGEPEHHWYYQCSFSSEHHPQAVESGPFTTFIDRQTVVVQVPEREVHATIEKFGPE